MTRVTGIGSTQTHRAQLSDSHPQLTDNSVFKISETIYIGIFSHRPFDCSRPMFLIKPGIQKVAVN